MTTTTTARKTGETTRGEFSRKRYPIYEGGPVPVNDRRIRLDDGTACYVWYDHAGAEPLPVLCTELVAMDAGDNVVRRRRAATHTSHGMAGPAVPTTQTFLVVVPADGTMVGYYREVY